MRCHDSHLGSATRKATNRVGYPRNRRPQAYGAGGCATAHPRCDESGDESEHASEHSSRQPHLEHGKPGCRWVRVETEQQSHDTPDGAEQDGSDEHGCEHHRHLAQLGA